MNYSEIKIGQTVICNGREGTVTDLCEWTTGLVEVRLSRGSVCTDASELEAS